MNKPKETSAWVTIVLPIVCALFAIGCIYYQMRRLSEAKEHTTVAEKHIALLKENIKDAGSIGEGAKLPTLSATSDEDTVFLDELKKAAQESGITIVKWDSKPKPAGSENNATQPAILKGVTAIHSDLEVYGPYESVRAFVIKLESWPRLLNMNSVAWHRGTKTGTRLFMDVTRYVTEVPAPAGGGTQPTETGGKQ